MEMRRDSRITAGLHSLYARLRLDAGLGVEHIAGTDILRALEEFERSAAAPRAPAPRPSAPPERRPAPAAAAAVAAKQPRPAPRVSPVPGLPAGHVSLVPYEPSPANAAKEALLADLRRESETCARCALCGRRSSVVWGEGSLDADILFIGEGPGKDEDIEGRPFVGRSGRLLTDIIEKGMRRPRSSVYIANVVKCRPPGNRDPRADEVAACSLYLKKQIAVIAPAVIVAVGMVAARALLGIPAGAPSGAQKLRGVWKEYEGIPLRVIFHPSYLLRLRQSDSDRTDADKATWKNVQEVLRKAAEIRGC